MVGQTNLKHDVMEGTLDAYGEEIMPALGAKPAIKRDG